MESSNIETQRLINVLIRLWDMIEQKKISLEQGLDIMGKEVTRYERKYLKIPVTRGKENEQSCMDV